MSKKKKLNQICALVMSVSSCLLFTGCPANYPDLNEIAPEAYGEWDGNYIYCGNVRAKTTGAGDEYLVQNVVKDGMMYRVAETTDYEYVGEQVWLCLELENTGEIAQATQAENAGEENAEQNAQEKATCLLRYDLRTHTASAVYFGTAELPASRIHKIGEASIVLSHWTGTRDVYFRIDYNGNVLDENAWDCVHSVYYGAQDEYVLAMENGIYSYALWETGKYTAFYQAEEDASVYVYYLKQGEQEGFLMHEQYAYTKDEGHTTSFGEHLQRREDGLLFYDIGTGKTTRILEKTEKKVCTVQGDYVVIGGEEIFESRWLENLSGFTCQTQYNAEILRTDCALYRIDLSNTDGAALEKLDSFNGEHADEDFSGFALLWDGTLAFHTYGIERGSGCYSGGPYENHYIYDPKTGELTMTERGELYERLALQGTVCGDYLYYDQRVAYGYGDDAYTLYRYNAKTGEKEAMQFWLYNLDEMEAYEREAMEEIEDEEDDFDQIEFRFSQKMWFGEDGYANYSMGEYLVLDY